MFGIGPWEIAIVLVIILLLFGKRIPQAARSLGMSITEFKKGVSEDPEANKDTPTKSEK